MAVVRHIPAIYKLPQHMNVVDAHDFLKSIENKYKFDSQKRISFMTTVPMKNGVITRNNFILHLDTYLFNESKHYTTLDTVVISLKYLIFLKSREFVLFTKMNPQLYVKLENV